MNSDKNNFRFGRKTADGERGYVQVENLSGETHSSVRHPQSHGFESSPPADSESFTVYQGGNPDSGAVLVIAGQAPITLAEGESVVYSAAGATVHCKGDGTIELNGSAFGGLIKIDELTTKINTLIDQLQGHVHYVGTPGSNTLATGTTLTKLSASDYENEEVNHG